MHDISRLTFILSNNNNNSLDQITERKRLDSRNLSISTSRGKEVPLLGSLGVALQVNLLSSLPCGLLGSLVGLDTLDNLLLTLGLANVFDSDMDSLLDDTSIHELVHTDADGALGNVEDDAGTAVVVLVGHALVDGGVGEDIYVIADLDREEVLREVGHAMLPEFLGEHVARTRTDTV